jgi:transcription elongation factor GreA
LGSQVTVLDVNKDEKVTYHLVTSEDADATQGKVSTSSPIGKALLHRKPGDEIKLNTPGGVRELEVLEIVTVHEVAAQEETKQS